MKKLILAALFISFTVGLFAFKLYVSDGDCEYTEYSINSYLERLSDRYYRLTPNSGDYADVPFTQNMTTIGFEEDVIGIPQFRALVVSKTDDCIEFYTSVNVNDMTINDFFMQISVGHAVSCRNHLIAELDGIVPAENVYAGTIGLQYNLLGIADIFNFDIISLSKIGLNDNANVSYGIPFHAADKLIVHAHYRNDHVRLDWTTYVGDIVAVSYGNNTGLNQGSYGPGSEFFVDNQNCQSYATPHLAGMFAKLKIITGESYDEIRLAFRETASFNDWVEDGGYGAINYEATLAMLEGSQVYVVNEVLPSTGGTITIDELESIAFSIDAYDPGGNDLVYNWELDGTEVSTTDTYNFTTDYTSAGSYNIALDVTDDYSNNSLNYTWNITVNDVNQIIVVNEVLPSAGGSITIDELESIAFSIDAYDPDGNALVYNWELDEIGVSTTDTYNFTTDYASAGNHIVTLDVDNNSLNYAWNITVNDIDQIIVVNEVIPSTGGSITIDENESITFSIDAYDPDGNTLVYNWELDGTEVSTTDSYDFVTDYSSTGSYIITLDVDNNSLNYAWNITVNDIDQNIAVNNILPSTGGSITIDENESIAFSIDAYDPDGNTLVYNWELDGIGVSTTDSYNFVTDYTSAGSYIVTLSVDDNSLNYTWNIAVNDIDQIIVVNEVLPSFGGTIAINELESIVFSIDAYDPDGNTLVYNWELDGIGVSTTDSYDFVTDYTSAGSYIVTLSVDDNSLNYTWDITVNDVDQPIVINALEPVPGVITMQEMENLILSVDAYDPDGNELEYLWKLDGEEVSITDTYNFSPDYNAAGEYLITLLFTDNFSDNSLEYEWDVIVEDVNFVSIETIEPSPEEFSIAQNETVDFIIIANNPYGEIYYSWILDGYEVSTTNDFLFDGEVYSLGDYNLQLNVSTDANNRETMQFEWSINIVIPNLIPIADAGEDLYVDSDGIVKLDGSGSFDPEGKHLSYHWIAPEEIVLSNSKIVNPTFMFATPDISGEVEFLIQLIVNDGDCNSEIDEIVITVSGNTFVNDLVDIPNFTKLQCNYPNPFNPTTTIKFDVQDDETATLTIFNVKGQIIEYRDFTSGSHNFEWNAQNRSSGVYYYQLKSSSYTNTKKMILLK